MVKWQIILTLMFLLTANIAIAAPTYDLCEYKIAPTIETPCTMITHTLNQVCNDEYTYNITMLNTSYAVENGTLAYFSDGQYYLNFTEDNGDYTITTCDGASRQVRVQRKEVELKMIAIVLGFIFIIAISLLFGVFTKFNGYKLLAYGLAAIQTLLLVGFMYADYSGINYTWLLRVNFITFVLLAFAAMWLSLTSHTSSIVDPSQSDVSGGKWGKRWR